MRPAHQCPNCQIRPNFKDALTNHTSVATIRGECPNCGLKSPCGVYLDDAIDKWNEMVIQMLEEKDKKNKLFEEAEVKNLLLDVEVALQRLGASLVEFLDCGFDPDACYTPLEIKIENLATHFGINPKELNDEAYKIIKEAQAEFSKRHTFDDEKEVKE